MSELSRSVEDVRSPLPDLDLGHQQRPAGVFTLLHDGRPVLLNLGEPGGVDIPPWADRAELIDGRYMLATQLSAMSDEEILLVDSLVLSQS